MNTDEIMQVALTMAGLDEIPDDSAIHEPGDNIKKIMIGVDIGTAELMLAKQLGYDAQITTIEGKEIAHYYPGAKKMSISLVFDAESHLLLGAEITAPSTLGAKKIDVFATAIAAKMRIDDIQKLDLSYAPPSAPVWDPILIAANVARKKCK